MQDVLHEKARVTISLSPAMFVAVSGRWPAAGMV
jgi:hypothetical protein